MPDETAYTLEITDDAKDDLKRIDRKVAERIVRKLRWLAQNTENVNHEALTGQWIGYYRYRIGDYRAIYELDRDGTCSHRSGNRASTRRI